MLNKFKSLVKGNQESVKEEVVMDINVEAVMDELVKNGEIVEEVSFMESLALDTMTTLKESPVLFNRIMKAKPENVYEEVRRAIEQLRYVSHANEKINRDAIRRLKAEYKKLESELTEKPDHIKHKVQAFFSVLLHEAGLLLVNTGVFAIETTGIITVFALRMIGHLGRETRWACQEIGKSFNHRLIQPYKTK